MADDAKHACVVEFTENGTRTVHRPFEVCSSPSDVDAADAADADAADADAADAADADAADAADAANADAADADAADADAAGATGGSDRRPFEEFILVYKDNCQVCIDFMPIWERFREECALRGISCRVGDNKSFPPDSVLPMVVYDIDGAPAPYPHDGNMVEVITNMFRQ